MARIATVPGRRAGWYAKMAYYFTRRGLRRLTGRDPERIIEPLEVYAHVPGLLRRYAGLEQATAKLSGIAKRARALAELRAATVVGCEYCIDMGSQVSRQWGLSDEELLALPSYRTSALFSDLDKLVLDYATGMSRTPVDVPDELFASLRAHFGEAQLVELTHVIALENLRGRFNLAFGIPAAGFSEGMVCAVPDTAPPGLFTAAVRAATWREGAALRVVRAAGLPANTAFRAQRLAPGWRPANASRRTPCSVPGWPGAGSPAEPNETVTARGGSRYP